MKEAYHSGLDLHAMTMSYNIRKAFSIGNLDMQIISYLFGINNYLNLELLDELEIDNDHFVLSTLKNCFEEQDTVVKQNDVEFDNVLKTRQEVFLSVSPCQNLTEVSACEQYCKWHKSFVTKWTQKNIRSMMEYVYIFFRIEVFQKTALLRIIFKITKILW